jgi:hypothetical protein
VFYTKTFSHLWQYVAEFFLERKVFQTKLTEKMKTHILCSITFFRKSCPLCDNVEKYGAAREVTDDNIIRHMHFACCISKATRPRTHAPRARARAHTHAHTHTHTKKYVMRIAFPRQQWFRERDSMLRHTLSHLLPEVTLHATRQLVNKQQVNQPGLLYAGMKTPRSQLLVQLNHSTSHRWTKEFYCFVVTR